MGNISLHSNKSIHGYMPKSLLAQMYFRTVAVSSAVKELNSSIKINKKLHTALLADGWHIRMRLLSPKMVQTIIHYLGEP